MNLRLLIALLCCLSASAANINFLYPGLALTNGSKLSSVISVTNWNNVGVPAATRNDGPYTAGCDFTTTQPLTVTALGYWVIAGSTHTHPIGIWNSSQVLLGSVVLNTTGLAAGYQFAKLSSPVVLAASTQYFIAVLQDGSGDLWAESQETFPVTSVAVIGNAHYFSGAGLSFPSSEGAVGSAFAGINFQYIVP